MAVTSLYLAFTEYNVLSPAKWVGLDNFHKMFYEDKLFWTSFWVTFKFALNQVPVKLTVSLLVALVLSRGMKFTSYYRAAFYIPSLMGSSVAIALLWKQLFAFNGVINQALGMLGLPSNQRWLGDPKTALGVLISLGVWQFGSSMLIFLAAIKNIPASFHEAAIVDGAGPVKRFFSITLPMITPILFFDPINQVIGSFQAFNSNYLITGGKPLNIVIVDSRYCWGVMRCCFLNALQNTLSQEKPVLKQISLMGSDEYFSRYRAEAIRRFTMYSCGVYPVSRLNTW